MKKLFLLLVAFCLLAGGQAFGASSMTEKEYVRGGLHIMILDWIAHTDGVFTSVQTSRRIDGYVVGFQTDPGDTAPAALYDITITDLRGQDIAFGTLGDRSATVTQYVQRGVAVFGEVTLAVSNIVTNSGNGRVTIFYYGIGR